MLSGHPKLSRRVILRGESIAFGILEYVLGVVVKLIERLL